MMKGEMMDKKKIKMVLIVGLVMMIAFTGCRPKVDPVEEENARHTMVAATVGAQATKTAIARPTDTPVPTNTPVPTATIQVITPTDVIPTAAMGTTQTAVAPGATVTYAAPTTTGGVDAGVWARSAPADDSTVKAGEKFQVVVTLMNTGSTTWTPQYYIEYVDGNNFNVSSTKYTMPIDVPPSMSIQFTLNFTAPQTVGTAKSNWQIVNPSGTAFGFFYFQYIVQ
jgi:hypothetical protein